MNMNIPIYGGQKYGIWGHVKIYAIPDILQTQISCALAYIKEFCKVKISIFTRNTILWPHFPDGWDDAHAQI